ncbi:lactococcin 972 family bacteriocin [Rathayibacter sp. VKM Ac-2760]|uniref:lactococcin 972 family bacteriocin n=1 Tax=Rathayibacter sp. VKM Ac-2760 TaxID=2609253 RepID=UPI0013187BC3|nr:lactococcin 972 family bacteriocin [Rathayibacter sp. VKM Ac-2760]QHC57560.1 hypothetical protein GSU72_02395 [Rathayibacter sp. VKM Ac-2760]
MSFRAPGSRRSFITALALTGAIIAAPVAAAYTVTNPPEGGTWIHGTTRGIVLSSYEHESREHKATVYNGEYHYAKCKPAGVLAAVSAPARDFQVDSAYYDVCS